MGVVLDILLSSIVITPEILSLVAEIDEFKGSWNEMHTLSPARLSALKKVATVESIGSSTRIEGAQMSDGEIEILLSQALVVVNAESLLSRDQQEVAGYAFVCDQICENYLQMPFTENLIKQLHYWLLQYTSKDQRHRGNYKNIPIRIEMRDARGRGLSTLLETTSPFETPMKMQELVKWTNDAFSFKDLHPLLVIGLFTVIFLAIHPFQDGNGRLSRLLTTLLMLKCGYAYATYSSLESVIEANKENYYLSLQQSQKSWQNNKPDWTPWLLFFLHCLQRQKKHLEVKLEREKILQIDHSELSKKLLELLSSHGSLTISDFVKLTQANRNTLKATLAKLSSQKRIILNGKGKSSFYSLF